MEEMSRCLSRRELLAALLLFTLLILLTPSALGAHVAQLSGRELAAASSLVVVAVVEDREVRWNGKHTLLMTDYTLRVGSGSEARRRSGSPSRCPEAPSETLRTKSAPRSSSRLARAISSFWATWSAPACHRSSERAKVRSARRRASRRSS